ncbi:MAG: hypothetical protein GY841_09440, partial [FCB group bacterium]|nr:hypothetical protein [FCB group bacterium]
SGDLEILTLTETGANTGVFEGAIPMSAQTWAPGNGILETSEDYDSPFMFDTLTAIHTDGPDSSSTATATTLGSRTWFLDAYGAVTSSYPVGATAYLRVEDHNYGQPGIVDNVPVVVGTFDTGDYENFFLVETGPDTAIYEGSIPLVENPTGNPVDGQLQVVSGARIE